MKKQTLLTVMSFVMTMGLFAAELTVTDPGGDPDVTGTFPNIVASAQSGDVITFDFAGEEIAEFEAKTIPADFVLTIDGLNKNNNKKVKFTGTKRALQINGLVTLKNCIFTGKRVPSLYVTTNSDMVIENCDFINNESVNATSGAPSAGGALQVANSAKLKVVNSLFEGNKSGGGTIVITTGAETILEGCTFKRNYSSAGGGAIYMYTTKDQPIPSLTATNCTFVHNTAAERGGAIYAWSRTAESFGLNLINCTITANYSARNIGGGVAIFCSDTMLGEITMVNTILTGNVGGSLDDNYFSPNDFGRWEGPNDKDANGTPYTRNYKFNTANCIYGVSMSADNDSQTNIIKTDVFGANSIKNDDFKSADIFKELYKLDNTVFVDIESDEVWSPVMTTVAGLPVAELSPNSIAIAQGTASYTGVTIPTTDQLGTARPAAPSIGALEIQEGSNLSNIFAEDFRVWPAHGGIYFAGADGAIVTIYTSDGRLVNEVTASANTFIPVDIQQTSVLLVKVRIANNSKVTKVVL